MQLTAIDTAQAIEAVNLPRFGSYLLKVSKNGHSGDAFRQFKASFDVQDERSVFLLPTKTKYLHPCKQLSGAMNGKELALITFIFSTRT